MHFVLTVFHNISQILKHVIMYSVSHRRKFKTAWKILEKDFVRFENQV